MIYFAKCEDIKEQVFLSNYHYTGQIASDITNHAHTIISNNEIDDIVCGNKIKQIIPILKSNGLIITE